MNKSFFFSSFSMEKNLIWAIFLLFPAFVLGECTCAPEEEGARNKRLALKYKLGAIASILVASAVGVWLPAVGRRVPALGPDTNIFFIVKAFAAGVILSTGFIHVLPDAFDNLTSPCISQRPWGDFPFTGFISMLSAIGTLMIDAYATRRLRAKTDTVGGADAEGGVPLQTHATHGHSHGAVLSGSESDSGESDLRRHRVISQVLEMGIIVHSVIIGIALGASQSPKTIRPLIAALSFHQFFEGLGLGGCITQARFNLRRVAIMTLFFSLTTPVGIAIGIGITNSYSETSPNALIIGGVLNAASAGILIYMALVDLLSADFLNPKVQNNGKLLCGANVSLLLGAGCMSLLAKWA